MFVKNFTIKSLGIPHKQEIPELNGNYAHVIHGPTLRNQ